MTRKMTLLLAVTLLFGGLAACGTPQNDAAAPASSPTPVEEAVAVPSEPADATSETAPSASPTPVTEKKTVRVNKAIPYATRTIKDSSRPAGTKSVRVSGVAGVRTLTYEVTLTNGTETGRKLVKSEVTKQPVTKVIVVGTKSAPTSSSRCDPNYSGQCVPIASDVDCGGGSGNGPAYVYGVVKVIGTDIYDLDRDHDGYGCE